MRISDWSSDVCSSDLGGALHVLRQFGGAGEHRVFIVGDAELRLFSGGDRRGVLADFGQVAVGALDEDGGGADLGGIIHGTDLLDLEVANDVALLRDGHARFPLLSGMASKSSLEVAAINSRGAGAATRAPRTPGQGAG